MSTVIANNKHSRFSIIHFILSSMIALTMISIFFMDDKGYERRIKYEVAEAMEILSKEDWDIINAKITRRFNSMYYESGIYDHISNMFIPKQKERTAFLVDEGFSYRAVNNISYFFYQVVYRITTFEYWLALLLPLIICIVITGFNRWRINRYRMGGANTSRARIYLKFVWMLSLTTLIVLAVPNFFATFGVYMPAIIMLGMALVISKFISSYQKDF